MSLKLFKSLKLGRLFTFGDKPNRLLIKSDDSHYVAPEGRRSIHPHVAVIEKEVKTQPGGKTIHQKFKEGYTDE